ncbi:Cof-type HAD-IIB family hydrolase [Alicyclobacillus fastidiosus]|uniref:Cof-type HAD-IIB family hydrolase n=1 Tax=Alicyclobacillus fastidiosus TaxID=392011 RepID=A0ABV5AJ05_9BACL|nr:Cof-type HAD-IIB family hydrolase [Alicyclobacillus fastidiosus]WEH07820.1 Cof-type HAD-IIB family hydrolase [Alicyclobacillus fastidiosus]
MTETSIDIVFLDIDGTLYADGGLVRSGVLAVEQLLKRDIPVALCTGRSVLHAQHVQDELNVPYGIYFNGGLVKSRSTVLYKAPFPVDDVLGIMHYAAQFDIPTVVHTHEKAVAFESIPERYEPVLRSFDFPQIEIVENGLDVLRTLPVYQINAFMTPEWDADFERRFPGCYIYRWNPTAVDFQRRKSDKSIGAMHLLTHLGISPENAVHIGDGGNDIGMFRTLGHSYAMGNAEQDVKREAKRVTADALDDGVAKALYDLGLIDAVAG